ncbi:FtsK/SpoIIIE domain-containing protein [Floccifex sp.]|uniref:FHA domain-containing protein n=1 Tax=Floccifex sp. TaxID=2815810 RepID=UPI003F025864
MKKIQIIHDNQCEFIVFEKEKQMDSFQFVEQKESIQIKYQDKIYILKSSLKIENVLLFLIEKRTFSIVSLSNFFNIGRDTTNQCVIKDAYISNHHCQIQKQKDFYQFIDCDSTNGVYINGKKEKKYKLKDGDILWMGKYEFVYFDQYLIIPFKTSSSLIESKKICFPQIKIQNYHCLQHDFQSIQVESYSWDAPIKKQKIFQSVGSSICILLSSLISGLFLFLNHPEQKEQLLSMLCMSCSMAFAFLLYGLYNRHIQYQVSKQEVLQKEKDYFYYLDCLYNDFCIQKKEYEEKIVAQELLLKTQMMNPDQILIDIHSISLSYFQLKDVPFQFLQSKMNQNIKKWIKQHPCEINECIYLSNQQALYLPSHLDGWLQMLCSINNDMKYVCVGKAFKDAYYLCHEKCREGNKRLWIFDEKSEQLFLSNQKENQRYVFLVHENVCTHIELKITNVSIFYPFIYQAYQIRQELKPSPPSFKEVLHISSSFSCTKRYQKQVCLKVVLGFDEQGKVIELDLDERKDGVHGLIAGATGSGKSELLSLILLQLILNNSSKQFQFIVIDFKGGAISHSFSNFAHCGAMITNLDHDLKRFFVCMKKLIEQRQQILAKEKVSSIQEYNTKIQDGMSHILIVVDEMAQLKEQSIEALSTLKSIARIGRSLGIHLILSTQKPLGVIDDQIWANTSFHICLKVNTKQDSMEVLHNGDAYTLKQPGQFILQRESCLKGMSYYIKERETKYCVVNDYDEVIEEVKEKQSVFDFCCQKIMETKNPISYFVLPKLESYPFQNELFVYEDLNICQQKAVSLQFGQSMIVCTQENIVCSLVSNFKGIVYAYRFHELTNYVDQVFDSTKDLYELSIQTNEFTLIVHADENWYKYNSFFQKKNIRLLVFVQDVVLDKSSFDFRCTYHCSFEKKKQFFSLVHVSSQDQIEMEKGLFDYYFHFKKAIPKQNKKRIPQSSFTYLGQVKDKWVVWTHERKLLIVYAQHSQKEKIENWIRDWKDQDKIQVINIVNHLEFFQSTTYLEHHYDWDVLWIGAGYLEYGLYLRKKNIPSSSLMFWDAFHAYSLEEDNESNFITY